MHEWWPHPVLKCVFNYLLFITLEPEPPDIEYLESIVEEDKDPPKAAIVVKWKVGIYYDPVTGVSRQSSEKYTRPGCSMEMCLPVFKLYHH